MTIPTIVEARVYEADTSDSETGYVGSLSEESARQFEEVLNDTGSGSVVVEIESPFAGSDLALLRYGRVVKVKFDDDSIPFSWIVETKQATVLADGDEAVEVVIVAGRGCMAFLERAVVYPELGIGRQSPDSRALNFASVDFDDTSWVAATQIKQQSDPDSSKTWFQAPKDWPDPDAWWIWSRANGGGSPPQPVGKSYFRHAFTVTDADDYSIFVSGDDGYRMYLDDAMVAEQIKAFQWRTATVYKVYLEAGDHLLAFMGENIDRPSAATNFAGLIFSVIKSTDGGSALLGNVLTRSSSATLCVDYPTVAPTMTPGQIMRILIEEAQTRGCIPAVTLDFTDTEDSNGDGWSVPIDVVVQNKTDLLAVLRKLCADGEDVGVCDATWDYDAQKLRLWNKAHGTNRAATVELIPGSDVGAVTAQGERAQITVGLVKYSTGEWAEYEDIGATMAWGRFEAGLELGSAPSSDAAEVFTGAVFDSHADPKAAIDFEVSPNDGDPCPYVDFFVGDLITGPDEDRVQQPLRVKSLLVRQDDANGILDFHGSFFSKTARP